MERYSWFPKIKDLINATEYISETWRFQCLPALHFIIKAVVRLNFDFLRVHKAYLNVSFKHGLLGQQWNNIFTSTKNTTKLSKLLSKSVNKLLKGNGLHFHENQEMGVH